jgi:cytochrome c-type biogenesis protein CcmF
MLVARHRQRYGGYLVHLGLIALAVGVIGSQFFQSQRDGLVQRGQSFAISGYTLTYEGITDVTVDNVETIQTHFTVRKDGTFIEDIYPGEKIYPGFENQPTSIVSITSYGLTDLYVFLAGFEDTSSATIRVFINPLVPLVWFGGALMLLGGILCWWPLRRVQPGRLIESKAKESSVEVPV